jgi:hypothetical protein
VFVLVWSLRGRGIRVPEEQPQCWRSSLHWLKEKKDNTYALIAVCASQLWLFKTRAAAVRSTLAKVINWAIAAFCWAV